MKNPVASCRTLAYLCSIGLLAGCGSEVDVGVSGRAMAPTGSAVTFVSNTVPTTMFPGERINVQVVTRNSGTVDWSSASEWGLRAPNFDFGWFNDLIDSPVAQGATSTHNFVITAPASSATFQANGFSFVSGMSGILSGGTLSIPVTVDAANTPQWRCTAVSNTIPNPIVAGAITSVDVSVRNDGSQTWGAGEHCLYARENVDVTAPSLTRWGSAICTTLASPVAPGGTATFTFNIAAPASTGSFRFMRQMRDLRSVDAGGVAFFEDSAFCVDELITVSAGTPTFGASVVSDTMPATVAPNDVINVSVTMQNDGTTTWTAGSTFQLYTDNSPPNLWGFTTASVTSDVPNGGQFTFPLSITVPGTTGTETIRFRMRNSAVGFFGDAYAESIDISGAVTPTFDASFTANTFPATVAPNSPASVSVTVRNDGTTTWPADGTITFDSLNTPVDLWDVTRIPLTSSVPQNGTFTFNFTVRSPNTVANELFVFRMNRSGVGRFGDTLSQAVSVSGAVTPPYGATVVSQTIPATMVANSSQTFTIVMRNAGTDSWTGSSDIFLRSVSSPTNLFTNASVQLTTTTTSGADATFTFNVTAPSAIGTYESRWQMFQSGGVGLFGDVASTPGITVTAPPGCGDGTVAAPETCDDGNSVAGDGCSASCIIEGQTVNLASAASGRTFFGQQQNRQLSTMTIGDLDGDGFGDFLTSDFSDIGQDGVIRNQSGRVYVYSGGASFFTGGSSSIGTGATTVIWGRDAGDHLGGLLGGIRVGDVTGDGNADLVVGAELADGTGNARSNAGEVYVFVGGSLLYGGGTWDLATSSTVAPIFGAQRFLGTTVVGEAAGDRLRVLAVGDVTNDGTDDIIAGAYLNDSNGTSSGEVYVIEGGAALATTSTVDLSSATIAARVTGPGASALVGTAAAVGDLSGDGINDLVVSAPNFSSNGRTRNGVVYVIRGPIAGTYSLPGSADTSIVGETSHVLYGMDLAVADVSGSSSMDLVVGAPQAVDGSQTGEVHIWQGPLATGERDNAVTGASTSIFGSFLDYVGSSVEAGDANGDGVADILFGAGLSDGPSDTVADAGEMGIVLGQATPAARVNWTTFVAPFRVFSPGVFDLMGYMRDSVAAGDIDGDGRADWCVGARLGGDSASPAAGRIDCFQSPW